MDAVACEARPTADFPVLGPENRLLRHCLETILPGREITYNPIVLVGREGSGKSHCLDYVESRWRHSSERASTIARWDGGSLEREIVAAIQSDSLHRIHQRFVSAQIVLIDGLDRIEKTDVFHLFAAFLDRTREAGGQIVITLRRVPTDVRDFPPSLVSRLLEGLLVSVRLPEQESRRRVVAFIAQRCGMTLDNSALARLAASELTTDAIRERLEALSSRGHVRLDPHEAAAIVEEASETKASPSIRRIIATTARHYGLQAAALIGPSRHKNIANARSAAIFLTRRLTGKSLVDIGKTFGGRDHTTVLHSIRVTRKRSETDPAWQRDIELILSRLC